LYIRTILKELPTADVVHVRCPANISLLAIVLLGLVRHPRARWVKYAGNWRPDGHESWSYTFQRWWLHHNLHFGKVTINGSWPDQKPHEITFPNPSLTRAELAEAARYASQKVFTPPYRCAFVGRLERKKGPVALLEAVRQLRVEGIQVEADLIGDGPEAFEIKKLAQDLFAEGKVRFHGWTSRQELPEFLKNAHFIVLPTSCSEGWPKVLSEGMAYGVVPITTAISAIPHYLTSQENAWLLHQPTWSEVVVGIKWFVAKPERWLRCQRNALDSAHQFTYEHYLERLMNTVLPNRSVVIE
jgi:glycosyltransferase involved in cell wall biosynthesis